MDDEFAEFDLSFDFEPAKKKSASASAPKARAVAKAFHVGNLLKARQERGQKASEVEKKRSMVGSLADEHRANKARATARRADPAPGGDDGGLGQMLALEEQGRRDLQELQGGEGVPEPSVHTDKFDRTAPPGEPREPAAGEDDPLFAACVQHLPPHKRGDDAHWRAVEKELLAGGWAGPKLVPLRTLYRHAVYHPDPDAAFGALRAYCAGHGAVLNSVALPPSSRSGGRGLSMLAPYRKGAVPADDGGDEVQGGRLGEELRCSPEARARLPAAPRAATALRVMATKCQRAAVWARAPSSLPDLAAPGPQPLGSALMAACSALNLPERNLALAPDCMWAMDKATRAAPDGRWEEFAGKCAGHLSACAAGDLQHAAYQVLNIPALDRAGGKGLALKMRASCALLAKSLPKLPAKGKVDYGAGGPAAAVRLLPSGLDIPDHVVPGLLAKLGDPKGLVADARGRKKGVHNFWALATLLRLLDSIAWQWQAGKADRGDKGLQGFLRDFVQFLNGLITRIGTGMQDESAVRLRTVATEFRSSYDALLL